LRHEKQPARSTYISNTTVKPRKAESVKWSTIFSLVMLAECAVSFWHPLMMSNALICALLANKFREDEKKDKTHFVYFGTQQQNQERQNQ
jgi:hypothetical protein